MASLPDIAAITMRSSSVALLSVLFSILLASPAAQAQTTLKICYEDSDNFPWQVKGARGLSSDLVDMAAKRSGVRAEQLALPWKRCLSEVAVGKFDGVVGAAYNDERAEFAVYPSTADGKLDPSRRMKIDSYSLFRLVGSSAGWDGKQFTHLNGAVGAQLGYSVVGDLKKLGVAVDESGGSSEVNMRKLMAGRIALIALLTQEGDDLLENPEFAGKVEKILPPLIEKPYYIIFGKGFYAKHKKTVEDFWDALAVARESKEFKALRAERMKK